MRRASLLLLVACGSPAAPAVTPAPAPAPAVVVSSLPDAAVAAVAVAPVDAVEAPVGAVPIPGTYQRPGQPLNLLDTTVNVSDLPKPGATWKARRTLKYRGRISIALHVAGHTSLSLSVVDTETETETGYPGTLQDFDLGGADTNEQPEWGNAFAVRDFDESVGLARGPILFAVRMLPREGGPEAERRNVAVYTDQKSIYVAEKLVTATVWTPILRIDAPKAKEIIGMNPGWH